LNRARLALNASPSAVEIAELAADGAEIAKLRGRLSSISWFMAYLKEPLARRFNLEDGVDGHFWAERFGCVRLTTETALIACSSYVAMNPWRAGEAASLEASRYTAAELREADERSGEASRPKSGWLAPVLVSGDGISGAAAGRRPSDEGYLRMEWSELRRIVEGLVEREAAAELGEEREYSFPETLARLGITPIAWEAELRVTRRRFERLLDRAIRMRAEARRTRRK
jgi:hypothetical protein